MENNPPNVTEDFKKVVTPKKDVEKVLTPPKPKKKRPKKVTIQEPIKEITPPPSVETIEDEFLKKKQKLDESPKSTKFAIGGVSAGRKIVDNDDIPPKWFTNAIVSLKKAQQDATEEKKPSKEVTSEAKIIANEKWREPEVREKVQKHAMNSMDKLFNQMFPKRR